jgi:L-lactate dehydrogenase complex protein LldG
VVALAVSAAREEILRRVRAALADVPDGERAEDVTVPRSYRRADERPREELIALLCERISDYGAQVQRIGGDGVGAEVARACAKMNVDCAVVPLGLPAEWRPEGVEVVEDDGLAATALDELGAVAVTGCAAAIAETGTLVLDGQGSSGRRLLTLVPDHHICIVRADQVVGQVPEALAAVGADVRGRGVPISLVSGGSATSDIELDRVEGVHGPRHLLVLITE